MRTAAASITVNATNLFERRLADAAELLEPKLDELLPKKEKLAEAMRYAVLGNGKRFRPFLVLESAELFGAPKSSALAVAAAIECLHCYSLVHDDLPAMDDDDMRRGKPTVHKVFGEATAILAGDALLTLAFEILAKRETHPDTNVRAELILDLAQAAGWSGMAGGQQLDLDATDTERMMAMKTGALIRFSAEAGAIMAHATNEDRAALRIFGEQLGLAFQLSDDLLDAGKDATVGKKTFVTTFGISETRKKLGRAAKEAMAALGQFGDRGIMLREAAAFMLNRTT